MSIQTVIMAGGKGTRIAEINAELPKPMIPIHGKPILEYQIECLASQGLTDIILVVGHLKEKIMEYFSDGSGASPATGRPFGVSIRYIEENEPLGTAGALYVLKNQLKEDFLLLCGDIIFDVDIQRFYAAHRAKKASATIFTHPNSHPYDSGIVIADHEGRVTNWLHKEEERLWYKNRVNAGLHILSPSLIADWQELKKRDLDRDLLKPLISTGGLFCYDSPEYVKDMGTPDRYHAVSDDIMSGRVAAKNLKLPQQAIFLDRDGTINRYAGFISDEKDFELLDGAGAAIRLINESGMLAILITNQPVIARGECTTEELEVIHHKMETLLGREGAYLDGIYYCPHHPDRGFPGERIEYKIKCSCRKPLPGLIHQAATDFHIDCEASWMIGDSLSDIQCGRAAGCKTASIGEIAGADCLHRQSLLECVEEILGQRKNSNFTITS